MASSAMQSSGFVCRSCSRHLKPRLPTSMSRSFSSTSSNPMPSNDSPYSPYYVDIPFPPQRYAVYRPKPKGKRPTPREIFPKKNNLGDKKITAEYLASVSREPVTQSNPGADAPATEKAYIDWKAKMSASRRKNIREGLLELHAQKQERERKIAARSDAKQRRREELLAQDDAEDVKLTTPSILSALRFKGPLTDPDREVRLAMKRANYESREQAKAMERQEELHELYIRSHSFIFTERQLDQTINQAFEVDPTRDYVKIPPPDTRSFFKQGHNNSLYFKDDDLVKSFMDALTGGGKRDPVTTMTRAEREEAMTRDVLNPDLPYSTYGFKQNEKSAAEQSRKKEESYFNQDYMNIISKT